MTKYIGGLALMASMILMGDARLRADDDPKKAKADIEALADALTKGGKGDVAAIKKKYEELNTIMHAYKPREKGGIGIGPKGKLDGIERKIIQLGRTALSKAKLDKEKAELARLAYINIAIAKITHAYAPKKPKGGKGAKEWNGYASEQEKASKDLLDAVKKGDSAAIKKSAQSLNAACNNCHSDFRD